MVANKFECLLCNVDCEGSIVIVKHYIKAKHRTQAYLRVCRMRVPTRLLVTRDLQQVLLAKLLIR